MDEIVKSYGLRVANVFHAGDGNLHPLIMYNVNDPEEARKAEEAGNDILKLCVEVGGCLTGEHGVGIEKRDLMRYQFNEADLAQQTARARRVRSGLAAESRPRCSRWTGATRRDPAAEFSLTAHRPT